MPSANKELIWRVFTVLMVTVIAHSCGTGMIDDRDEHRQVGTY